MELTRIMIAQVLLMALVVAIMMGVVRSATVIFEADATFRRENTPKEIVQSIKKRDIMPKLWAPMYEGIIGEILLCVFAILVPMDAVGRSLLLIVAGILAIIIVMLGRFFSRSGRGNEVQG